MAKIVKLDPINEETSIATNDNLLSGLLQHDLKVLHECGGRGRCATCHVFIKDGMESLSPMSRREQRSLEVITTCNQMSRLACQTRVLGEGVVIELPSGTYLSDMTDIQALIGRRAQQNILHPLNGQVLVEAGKLMTRSMLGQLEDTREEVSKYLSQSQAI